MAIPILSTGTHVLIGDGKKAFILFNEGTSDRPSLTVETILVVDIVSNSSDPATSTGKGRAERKMHG